MKAITVVCALALWATASSAEARGPFVVAEASGANGFRTNGPATSYNSGSASVLNEAHRWMGARNMTGRPGPWCASFASFVLRKTGRQPLANDTASAALAYGRRLLAPQIGSLAVISTGYGWAGHVGFVSGVNPDGSIQLLSGNWGHRVSQSSVSRRQVVAFVEVR